MNDLKVAFSVTPAWSVFSSCTSLKDQMTDLDSKVYIFKVSLEMYVLLRF